MIKISYYFRTIGPLHTGSDVNAGTMRSLRRQKCILADPVVYISHLTDEQRRDAVVQIALGVWYSINWDEIKGARRMGIWDEFANKLVAAARAKNKYSFLEKLCRSWGIRSIANPNVLIALDALDDYELMDTVRNESMYIMLKMRALKDQANESWNETGSMVFNLPAIKKGEKKELKRCDDDIPCISGNSIRGKMRRLIMHDFCSRVGLTSIDKRVYHTLFTGGFLDQSTKNEDLEKMELFISMCPPLGILGAAIGNMTIEGEMKVAWAYPLCKERGTGEKSYWEYLDTVFQTRHDSSKTEKDIEITGENQTQQMKYEYEVFADGTPFEHRIACTAHDPILISCFFHTLELFNKAPYLGGMGSVGNGEIDIEWSLPEGNSDVYLQYIEEEKDEIKEFWENATI